MTLNETYCDLLDNDSGFDNQLLADRCEKITDKFAVNFARYIHNNPTIFNNGWNMEMVLDFYKKENRQ